MFGPNFLSPARTVHKHRGRTTTDRTVRVALGGRECTPPPGLIHPQRRTVGKLCQAGTPRHPTTRRRGRRPVGRLAPSVRPGFDGTTTLRSPQYLPTGAAKTVATPRERPPKQDGEIANCQGAKAERQRLGQFASPWRRACPPPFGPCTPVDRSTLSLSVRTHAPVRAKGARGEGDCAGGSWAGGRQAARSLSLRTRVRVRVPGRWGG
jgi:hypothetical protein